MLLISIFSIIDSTDMSLSKLLELVKDGEPGVLQPMRSQRVENNLAAAQQCQGPWDCCPKLPSSIHSFSLYISWRERASQEKSLHPPEEPPFFNSEASHSCIFVLSVLVIGRRRGPSNWVSAKAKSASPRVHVLWQAFQYPFLTSLCKAWDQHIFPSDESDLPWRARRLSRISVPTSSQHGLRGRFQTFPWERDISSPSSKFVLWLFPALFSIKELSRAKLFLSLLFSVVI